MNYTIRNVGCDDETEGTFEFTEEQFVFLKSVFEELNKYSTYGCMPEIYIKETTEQLTEPPQGKEPIKAKPTERSYKMGCKCEICGIRVPDGKKFCFMCALEKGLKEYNEVVAEELKKPSSLYLKIKLKEGEPDAR